MEDAETLIKLILVDSNHFIRYKCKITHCLDPLALQKTSIQKASNLLKYLYTKRIVTFYFCLGSSVQCLLSVEIRSYFTQSIVKEYFSGDLTHNLPNALINNTPLKSFSVDFIHFEYCF